MKPTSLSTRGGWRPRLSPYLYQHDEPLRVFLGRLARAKSHEWKEAAQQRWQTARFCLTHPREGLQITQAYLRARVFTLSTLLILLWAWTLWQHEVVVFQRAIDACDWSKWEDWPQGAQPHHLVLVADPQLVDPHTYPGRPWPLSSLTVVESDIYMRRAYSRVQRDLDPDTVFFLGDLFDGGREWSTSTSKSPETQFQKYGDRFWYREFRRFSNIFLKEWGTSADAARQARNRGRRVIASLPGNHDLGFAQGVQLPVRERFTAMFGESNRMDIIANHTFVSIDAVSLSARDEQDTAGLGDQIWRPTWNFLEKAQMLRDDKIDRHLRTLKGQDSGLYVKQKHGAWDIEDRKNEVEILRRPQLKTADFPNILLTHVPLYRPPGTPCGPQREKYPPSPPAPGQVEAPTFDQRNAIAVARGYQYQNVISHTLSKFIIDSFGGTIGHVFSGDDHDYCEVVHRAYSNPGAGIREITVKSISFTMGVRKPGFLMLSLWNPVDKYGNALSADGKSMPGKPGSPAPKGKPGKQTKQGKKGKTVAADAKDKNAKPDKEIVADDKPASDDDLEKRNKLASGDALAKRDKPASEGAANAQTKPPTAKKSTIQTHQCLLPDQLGTFIWYGVLLGFSLIALFVRAFLVVFIPSRFAPSNDATTSILPTFEKTSRAEDHDEKKDLYFGGKVDSADAIAASTSSLGSESQGISSRGSAANRPRSTSPLPSYGYGAGSRTPSPQVGIGYKKKHVSFTSNTKHGDDEKPRTKAVLLLREWARSVWGVGWVVLSCLVLLQRR